VPEATTVRLKLAPLATMVSDWGWVVICGATTPEPLLLEDEEVEPDELLLPDPLDELELLAPELELVPPDEPEDEELDELELPEPLELVPPDELELLPELEPVPDELEEDELEPLPELELDDELEELLELGGSQR
jgi:hypothetical protein